jgi:hypothetical protein
MTNQRDNLQEILSRLENVQKMGDSRRAFCPVHGDTRTRHLKIEVDGEAILVFCFNCQARGTDVVRETGLSPHFLFLGRR